MSLFIFIVFIERKFSAKKGVIGVFPFIARLFND